MSIASEILRIQTAKANILRALSRKGIQISENATLDEFAEDIDPLTGGEEISYLNNPQGYLSFKFVSNGTVKWQNVKGDIEYSKDGGTTWTYFNGSTINVVKNDELWFRGSLTNGCGALSESSCSKFITTGYFYVTGNVQSLCSFDTTLQQYHFAYLFKGCTGLNTDLDRNLLLPVTTLAERCYYSMFYSCTSLITAPALPATTLATNCYYSMFRDCLALITAPALPVTTLTSSCYERMFYGCTSLTSAPELPATTLTNACYSQMFYNCRSLNYIKCLATDISASNCTKDWVTNVFATGTFVKHPDMLLWATRGTNGNGIPNGWTTVDFTEYFTIDPLENGTISFSQSGLQYSTDKTNWSNLGTTALSVTSANKVYFKGTLENDGIGRFSSSNNFNVEGNIMSLLYSDNYIEQTSLSGKTNVFYGLFLGCTHLISAEGLVLPATTLANACYRDMFKDCTSLTSAPELPATTLAYACYANMFTNCTSLTSAPALPATTLVSQCYNGMFQNCTSLNYIKCLAIDISESGCTANWVTNVAATGIFSKNTDMSSWTTGTSGIPSGWTVENACEYVPLTFVAQEDTTFQLTNNAVDYSLDGGSTWTTLEAATSTPTVTLGSSIMWKGTITPCVSVGIGTFSSTGNFIVKGNIMSLLYGDNFVDKVDLTGKDYAFTKLFYKSKLNDAEYLLLPATTLSDECYRYMFQGCTGLTTAPALPATTLTSSCYERMFYGCTSLTSAPTLPATILANSCYKEMFSYCTSLTSAPTLPATTLVSGCYGGMFTNCKSLTTAPALPATTLANACYSDMFSYCTSLTSAPALPATTLVSGCYQIMFRGCISLTSAPALPATTLAQMCYYNMFENCTGLTTAPELPATTLAENCYIAMFRNCTSLNYIKCLATDISASNCTSAWVDGVAATGTFVKDPNMTSWTTGDSGIPSGWDVINDPIREYLTISPTENGTISFSNSGLQYSTDKTAWTSWDGSSLSVTSGTRVYLKGTMTPSTTKPRGIGTFSSTNNFGVEGNPMSLLYGDDFIGQTSLSGKSYAFNELFSACRHLISVENLILPATTLADNCYNQMFQGCTGLTTAPELPATTLADYCYDSMFGGCTSLTSAPALPATILANNCYSAMFSTCTSLTFAPELPATTLADYCYYFMFYGCSLLTSAPTLPATTLADKCYYYMFEGCTRLTTAPELPATTLTNGCYNSMFRGCTGLTTAPVLPATTLTEGCYQYMFQGCTSLTTAPELPATTLTEGCYAYMFGNCTSLNYIKCLATNISATNCTANWVYNVAPIGTFVKNTNMSDWTTGANGIPSGWTVQDAS